MKLAVIIRGVPGSGKKKFAKLFTTLSNSYEIHTPEDFFLPGIKYRINQSNRARLDEQCFDCFVKSLKDGVEVVIYSHTNVIRFRYQRYVDAAKTYGYELMVVPTEHPSAEVAVMNTHRDISVQEIQSMIDTFER